MSRSFRIELLEKHDRVGFDCGQDTLNKYFRSFVSEDVRRHLTVCYVVVENETDDVAGYYTLAAGGVLVGDLPKQLIKRLPRYPSLPVARIGRLAVDLRYRGRRLSDALIADAIRRSVESTVAVFAIVVDAKDESLVTFYRDRGFVSLSSAPNTLFLPLSEAIKRLAEVK